jgi:CIC family chloride channel protein
MAGGAIGTLLQGVTPFTVAAPGAYALVGMGTLFAGIIRAPMTSVFMIFEITQDYQILVPLMIANLLSFVISRRYQRVPIYDALLRQDYVHLPEPAATGQAGVALAADVMRTDRVVIVSGDAILDQARQTVDEHAAPACLVGTGDHLLGAVSASRLAEAIAQGRGADSMSALVEGPLAHAHPDHTLAVVLERLAQSEGVLPIVSRRDVRRLEGAVTLEDVSRFLGRRRRL